MIQTFNASASQWRSVCTGLLLAAATTLGGGSLCHADTVALDKFGICDHPQRYADYDAACDEIIASGVKWVRISPEWGTIEPNSGEYNTAYLAKIDAIVNRLTEHDVNVLFILGFTAQWASSMPNDASATRYKPANWTDWENYVNFITTRYDGKIHYWEVWNEPDHNGFWKSSVQDYATLLQKAADVVHQNNVNNKVLMGGLAMTTGSQESYGLGTFFDSMLGYGTANYFDIVNYHAYGDAARFVQLHKGMRDVQAKYGIQSKRIWVTETGFTTAGNTAKEVVKADKVDQTYLTHFGLTNIDKIFWYVHRNPILNPSNPSEENFGLIANNRTPLKAFYHYQAEQGAESDFKLQQDYPTEASARRTLYYVPAASGDGSYVVNYATDGSSKRIPATRYMYFQLNDNWLYDANGGLDPNVTIEVTYLNSGTGTWGLHYDGSSNAYSWMSRQKTNTGTWATTTFALSDAKFANSQNNTADFRIAASSADLIISKVVVRKEMNKGRVMLGSTDRYRYIERIDGTTTTHENYNPVFTLGGKECRQISADNKFIGIRVSDGLARSGNTGVKIGLRFWDAGTDNLVIQYNSTNGNAYKSTSIAKTNTNTWRCVTVSLTDANFINAQNSSCDFRLSNGYDGSVEYVNQVDVELIP